MEITLRIWHMFRTISVQHEKIIQTCDFSGPYPFTHSKSSTIFALENQNKTVQIWQEQLKI